MNNKRICVKNGIDNLEEYDELLEGKKIGLVTNITGIRKDFKSTVDIINEEYDLRVVFSPEHGLRGEHQAGEVVRDYLDKKTGKLVVSLYGDNKIPTKENLKDIDILIYDIQDLGIRYYTYIYTMYLCMKACSENNITFVILDRINPLGGLNIEGNILECKYNSFVGMLPITNSYGLTIGELAKYIKALEELECNLIVVPVKGWNRGVYFDETDLPWIAPSPNIPTLSSALVYGGTCIFEGTNVSEGRGTTKPFEIIGAPWISGDDLSDRLNRKHIPGVYFRSIYFVPTFSKYKDEMCEGIQIHVTDIEKFSPIQVALNALYEIKEMYPNHFSNEVSSEGFKYNFFNHLVGCDYVLGDTLDIVLSKFKKDSDMFLKSIEKYFMY